MNAIEKYLSDLQSNQNSVSFSTLAKRSNVKKPHKVIIPCFSQLLFPQSVPLPVTESVKILQLRSGIFSIFKGDKFFNDENEIVSFDSGAIFKKKILIGKMVLELKIAEDANYFVVLLY